MIEQGETWEAHYNPDVGWSIWQGDDVVFTVFNPSSLEKWPGLEAKMAADKVLALGLAADHGAAAKLADALADAEELAKALEEGLLVFAGFHHHDESAYDADGQCGCGGMVWYESTREALTKHRERSSP